MSHHRSDIRARLINRWIAFLKKRGRPKKTSSSTEKRFLIVSATGIGDTLWSTPAIYALKKKYPHAKIDLLTSPLGFQVLKNNPHIDRFFLIKRSGLSLAHLYFKMKSIPYESIFIFHVSFRWIIPFCYFLNSKTRIGFDRHAKDFSHLLTHVEAVGLRHPIKQRIALLNQYTPMTHPTYETKLYLSEDEKKQAQDFLSKHKMNSPGMWIGIQAGASQKFKQWPIKHFLVLAQKLFETYNAKLVLFGSLDEAFLAQKIAQKTPCIVAAGKLPLRVSAALSGLMDLFISNDTGPMHMALAQKVPLIGIFSPTAHDLCWPYLDTPLVKLAVRDKSCIKCIGHRCHKPYCLERISPEEVFSIVHQFILEGVVENKKNEKNSLALQLP